MTPVSGPAHYVSGPQVLYADLSRHLADGTGLSGHADAVLSHDIIYKAGAVKLIRSGHAIGIVIAQVLKSRPYYAYTGLIRSPYGQGAQLRTV